MKLVRGLKVENFVAEGTFQSSHKHSSIIYWAAGLKKLAIFWLQTQHLNDLYGKKTYQRRCDETA